MCLVWLRTEIKEFYESLRYDDMDKTSSVISTRHTEFVEKLLKSLCDLELPCAATVSDTGDKTGDKWTPCSILYVEGTPLIYDWTFSSDHPCHYKVIPYQLFHYIHWIIYEEVEEETAVCSLWSGRWNRLDVCEPGLRCGHWVCHGSATREAAECLRVPLGTLYLLSSGSSQVSTFIPSMIWLASGDVKTVCFVFLLLVDFIAGMSYDHQNASDHWQCGCVFNSLFRSAWKKISKLCITCPLWWVSTRHWWIPLTKGQ